jgi:hypothetical protein
MKRRLGDRRAKARFEIVGELWGNIETSMSLVVRNIGDGGALLESPVALEPGSLHWVSALIDGDPQPVRFRVRHSTRTTAGADANYLLGVEFVSLTPAISEFVQRCLAADDALAGGL